MADSDYDKMFGGNDFEMSGGNDFEMSGGNEDMFVGGVREGYDSYGIYDPSTKKTIGRYISKTPSGAAKKAARRLFKSQKSRSLNFMIRKTTRGCKREIYQYSASLEVLKTPLIVNKDGNKIVIKNKISVTRVDLPPAEAAMMNMKKDAVKEKMMKKKEAEKARKAKAREVEKAKKAREAKKARKAAKAAKVAKAAKKPSTKKRVAKKTAVKKTKKARTTKKVKGGACGGASCNLYV